MEICWMNEWLDDWLIGLREEKKSFKSEFWLKKIAEGKYPKLI